MVVISHLFDRPIAVSYPELQGGIPYPMLSDPGGKLGALYGVYDAEAGVNQRGRHHS